MTTTMPIDAPSAMRDRGAPAFAQLLAVGQRNAPGWERYEAAMRGIFERRYYTNQGPLARELEQRLQDFLGVKHAVCVTNATIGLMMASEALAISGHALVPGVCDRAVEHALAWCGVKAVACDVDPATGQICLDSAVATIDGASVDAAVNAVIGANLWGGACDAEALASLARDRGLPVLFDSTHAFGCTVRGGRAGRFGALEVFSFSESHVLNAAGGACVATDDDELAARLRNIRSSYGAGRPVPVVKTSNGRMSEGQAAIGLLSLDDYAANQAHNQSLTDLYRARLSSIAGLRVVEPGGVDASNHQALLVELDERVFGRSRDALVERLAFDNVEARAVSRASIVARQTAALPVTARLCSSWLELPVGAHVREAMVETVCELIARAHQEETAA